MRFVTTALVTALLVARPAPAQATIGGEWRRDVEAYARQIIEAGVAPGLGVAVSQGEWVLWEGGFGLADANSGRRASADTPFYIASSTKALTATAVVMLASRGEIDLKAPIGRYIPGLRLRPPLDAVTVEQLLTMSDGIAQEGPVALRFAYSGDFTPEKIVALLADYGPSPAGNAFAYRNLPYNILGLALDPGDGWGWKAVVEREVLEPLGMNSTSAFLSRLDPERIALPHRVDPGRGWRRFPLAKDDANLHAAGGHFASARDLIRFVAAHASGGHVEGRRVFPAGPIRSMHEQRVDQERRFGPYERTGWGYGWDISRWKGRTIVQRFGGFSGYRSHMSFEPATGIGVVVMTNGAGLASSATDLLASYIYERLAGSADPEVPDAKQLRAQREAFDSGMADHLAERAARLAPLGHPLEHFAGAYENPEMGRVGWQVVAGGLEMRFGVISSRAEVFDAASDTLRIEIGSGTTARFEFPEGGGPATAVTIRGDRFERVGQ